jgi:hypothetical protein
MNTLHEYHVEFDDIEMLVVAQSTVAAQEKAIEELESMGETHGEIVRIRRGQLVQ